MVTQMLLHSVTYKVLQSFIQRDHNILHIFSYPCYVESANLIKKIAILVMPYLGNVCTQFIIQTFKS